MSTAKSGISNLSAAVISLLAMKGFNFSPGVCACVRVRERDRKKEREMGRELEKKNRWIKNDRVKESVRKEEMKKNERGAKGERVEERDVVE